ncbi:MAG: hypothetical protein L7T81_07200 [Candidatus Poseidoniaceae archaeon]|nr:hypothetical protein [Candidatus Poseidoniaceae archaeon]
MVSEGASGSKGGSPFKKWFMRQYWRVQQSQTIISMAFWVTTLTLLIWPYLRWRFENDSTFAGISTTYFGLLGIGATVIILVLLVGVVYDVTFGLWREHATIIGERNPFQTYQISPNFAIILLQTNLILSKLGEDDEDIKRHCEFVDRWFRWNVDTEIFARTMAGWENIMKDEDPFLPTLTEEERAKLAKRVEELAQH